MAFSLLLNSVSVVSNYTFANQMNSTTIATDYE